LLYFLPLSLSIFVSSALNKVYTLTGYLLNL
jgi:hypothetical protein